jgi:DNA gyrase inhibitor GyrI
MNLKSISVDVKEIPDMHVSYVRHIGPYKGDTALFDLLFTKLFRWAEEHDVLNFLHSTIRMSIRSTRTSSTSTCR